MRTATGFKMQSRAANEAGHFAVLGRMADEAGGFVDDQQIVVLVDDGEQLFHSATCFQMRLAYHGRR